MFSINLRPWSIVQCTVVSYTKPQFLKFKLNVSLYRLTTPESRTCHNVFKEKWETHHLRRACNKHMLYYYLISSLKILLCRFSLYVQTKIKHCMSALINYVFDIISTSWLYSFCPLSHFTYLKSAEYIKTCPFGDLIVLHTCLIVCIIGNIHTIIAVHFFYPLFCAKEIQLFVYIKSCSIKMGFIFNK